MNECESSSGLGSGAGKENGSKMDARQQVRWKAMATHHVDLGLVRSTFNFPPSSPQLFALYAPPPPSVSCMGKCENEPSFWEWGRENTVRSEKLREATTQTKRDGHTPR